MQKRGACGICEYNKYIDYRPNKFKNTLTKKYKKLQNNNSNAEAIKKYEKYKGQRSVVKGKHKA